MPLDATSHPATELKGGYRLETVKGTVRTLGQHKMHMRGYVYAFIKFDLEDGRDLMLEDVVVLNSVGSELEPGATGTFHLVINKRAAAVVSFLGADGRRGDDIAVFLKSLRAGKMGIAFFASLACLLVSIFASLILMALFRHTPLVVWVLFYTLPPVLIFRHFLKSVPSEADVRTAITASAV